jgi:thioredoxin reductase (NADPH)
LEAVVACTKPFFNDFHYFISRGVMKGGKAIDVAVIGAGPAGITAALYAKRKGLDVRLFEAAAAGGQAADAVMVENYPGVPKMKGSQLMQKMVESLKSFGVEPEEAFGVTGIEKKGDLFGLELEGGEERIAAKAVILCTGAESRKLGVPGEKELYGRGVHYCAMCDGLSYKGKKVAVAGAGNSGANAALFFAGICKKVFLVDCRREPAFDSVYKGYIEKAGVQMLLGKKIEEIVGREKAEALRLKAIEGGKEETVAIDAVFVYIGMLPRNALAKKLGVKLDKKGFVETGCDCGTSVPGVFAAGDLNGGIAQVVVAAGSGAIAAVSAYDYVMGLA